MKTPETPDWRLKQLTAQIVVAQVAHNAVPLETLPNLIRAVHKTLADLSSVSAASAEPAPAVPIKRSVHPDFLICLEDGKRVKMLRRYLQRFALTPERYRAKWGLPPDYPMTAPNYAERRSMIAKQFGLGQKRTAAEPAASRADIAPIQAVSTAAPRAEDVFSAFPSSAPLGDIQAVSRARARKRFADQPSRLMQRKSATA